MDNALVSLSNDLSAAVAEASQYAVGIHGTRKRGSAGVHWQPGIVLTAAHTLEAEDEVPVVLPDGTRVKAGIAGRDPSIDLAALRIAPGELPVPSIAEGPFRTGELALGVGRTIEGGTTAQLGVLSVQAGPWRTWRGGELDTRVRLDFALAPSGSGSVAITAAGKALGVATNGLSRFGAVVIPAATIQRTLPYLLERGYVPRGYLGVALQPVTIREHLKEQRPGLMLLSVEPESPAARAALHMGDILLTFGGRDLKDPADLQSQLSPECTGKPVKVEYLRAGNLQETEIVPGERK